MQQRQSLAARECAAQCGSKPKPIAWAPTVSSRSVSWSRPSLWVATSSLLHSRQKVAGRVVLGISDDLDAPTVSQRLVALGHAVAGVVRALGMYVGMKLTN